MRSIRVDVPRMRVWNVNVVYMSESTFVCVVPLDHLPLFRLESMTPGLKHRSTRPILEIEYLEDKYILIDPALTRTNRYS